MASAKLCDAPPRPLVSSTSHFVEAHHDHGVKPHLAVFIFLLVSLFCVVASYLGLRSDGVATIWLSNGLLFAILIRRPTSTWPAYLVIGYFADLLGACIVNGEPFTTSLAVCACNSLEVGLAAFLLNRWFGQPFHLSRPRPLFAFLAVGVVLAPAVACSVDSLWFFLSEGAPWFDTYRTWFLGDALGMAIVAPLVYALQEPALFAIFRRRLLSKTLLVLAAPAVGAFIDFSQNAEPLPVMVMPALIFATYRRGFSGAVIGVFLVACVAITLTVSGHGLMTLAHTSSPLRNIIAVQIFIAVTLFTIFPISALLEESQQLALSLKQSEARYMELAHTDALTGQANRRAFDERLQAEWRQAGLLTLLSLDVDLFKSYNDIYGHIAGDDCLRHIAAVVVRVLNERSSARLYRLGGEEFAVILPDANAEEALVLAERIRHAVFTAHIEHCGSPLGCQTISIGIATAQPSEDRTALSLLALSDQALYTAKHNGRNRCELAA